MNHLQREIPAIEAAFRSIDLALDGLLQTQLLFQDRLCSELDVDLRGKLRLAVGDLVEQRTRLLEMKQQLILSTY